ncbi:MAG: hypothetical protein INR71_08220 [Terriglobus roseus]|nr:hypothetical protein [Terriglobus roseus]
MPAPPQADTFIQSFYDDSAKKLFQPLKDLETRESMSNLTIQEVSLYSHLVEVLCFFIRQHSFRSKYFILSEGLASRVAQLMSCPEKHLKLTALKYFRTCIGLHDEFHNRQIIQHKLFDPILNIVFETMPRDNLLNSACLELFEFIKRENIKAIIAHLVENYRDRLEQITYVDIFHNIIIKYEQQKHAAEAGAHGAATDPNTSYSSVDTEPVTVAPHHHHHHALVNGGGRWHQGLKDQDADEEAYFNGEEADDDSDIVHSPPRAMPNGASPVKPLVDYPDEDDEDDEDEAEAMDLLAADEPPLSAFEMSPESGGAAEFLKDEATHPEEEEQDPEDHALDEEPPTSGGKQAPTPPPERISEKRRREDDDEDDELAKMAGAVGHGSNKRRSSSSSASSSVAAANAAGIGDANAGSAGSQPQPQQGHYLRRKRPMPTRNESGVHNKKIAISYAVKGGENNNSSEDKSS